MKKISEKRIIVGGMTDIRQQFEIQPSCFDLPIDCVINGREFNIQKEKDGISIYNLWIDTVLAKKELESIVLELESRIKSQIAVNTTAVFG